MEHFKDKFQNIYSNNLIDKNKYQNLKNLFIILSHELNKNNFDPSISGKKRCEKLANQIKKLNPDEFLVIFMGKGRKEFMRDSRLTISEHMFNYFSKNFFNIKNYVIEKSSLDTVGDAVFSYLIQKEILFNGTKTIISSDWHIERVEKIFKTIYKKDRKLYFLSTNEIKKFSEIEIEEIKRKEKISKNEFEDSFSNFINSPIKAYDYLIRNHKLYKKK